MTSRVLSRRSLAYKVVRIYLSDFPREARVKDRLRSYARRARSQKELVLSLPEKELFPPKGDGSCTAKRFALQRGLQKGCV